MDILERFKKYIAFETMSDENSSSYPSTTSQLEFGKMMAEDLKKEGVEDAYQDESGNVYGHVNNGSKETIGLIAHMDTAPTIIGGCKNPKLVERYDGGDIKLNEKYTLSPKEFKCLETVVGEDLLVTDGDHLLGGDDKAGIVIIFEFLKYYITHKNEFSYNLAICFTCDEEIGMGASHFDLKKMGADIAYTLDGGPIYVANYENFNAASGKLIIEGVGVHPGSAKDTMVNAVLIGNQFINLMPPKMTPADTEGYEGFIHIDDFRGDVERVEINFILRDHDKQLLEEKKQIMRDAFERIKAENSKAKIELLLKDNYKNMKDYFIKDMRAITMINKAYIESGTKLDYYPIRGGTDGATITYMGLPCPNLGVGDFNAHGRFEFVSVTQMIKMVDILKELFK